MVEIANLLHDCPLCRGQYFIELSLIHPVQVFNKNVPEYIPSDSKRYPCPECQKVFYRDDILHVNALVPFRIQFEQNADYIQSIENTLARSLSNVAHRNGAIHFRNGSDLDPNMGYRYHAADMFVVKPSAPGWKKQK